MQRILNVDSQSIPHLLLIDGVFVPGYLLEHAGHARKGATLFWQTADSVCFRNYVLHLEKISALPHHSKATEAAARGNNTAFLIVASHHLGSKVSGLSHRRCQRV